MSLPRDPGWGGGEELEGKREEMRGGEGARRGRGMIKSLACLHRKGDLRVEREVQEKPKFL